MKTFKIGDKVKYINPLGFFESGLILTIVNINEVTCRCYVSYELPGFSIDPQTLVNLTDIELIN